MDAVDAAFRAVPRAGFLPRGQRRRAAFDGPIMIGHGQTCSQPRTVEDMLRLLEVRERYRVLDVGSGSGWSTALLAELVGPWGEVIGVEIEPDLVTFGQANLARIAAPWARIVAATPGVLGVPEHAPYDRILVSAAARELPAPLVDQLAAGGRMVVPIDGTLVVASKDAAGDVSVSPHGSYRFVPLR